MVELKQKVAGHGNSSEVLSLGKRAESGPLWVQDSVRTLCYLHDVFHISSSHFVCVYVFAEKAREYLHKTGRFIVIGGIISPVHDSYGKPVSHDGKNMGQRLHKVRLLRQCVHTADNITSSSRYLRPACSCSSLLLFSTRLPAGINEALVLL